MLNLSYCYAKNTIMNPYTHLGAGNNFARIFLNDNQLTRFEEDIFKPILLKMKKVDADGRGIAMQNSKVPFSPPTFIYLL